MVLPQPMTSRSPSSAPKIGGGFSVVCSAASLRLRARYLVDVDCWSEVRGQPIKPGTLRRVLAAKLDAITAPVESPT